MDEVSDLVFEPDTSIAVGPYEAPTQFGAPEQYGSPENSMADDLSIVSRSGPDGTVVGSGGAPGQDAGPTGGLGLARSYPSSVDRCVLCEDETEDPVCGSDGKTYENSCELENYACRKYWDIVVVNQVRPIEGF